MSGALERVAEYVAHLEETVAKYGAGIDEYVVTLNLNHDEGGKRDALHLADLRALVVEVEQGRTDLADARDDSSEIALAERNEELRSELEQLRAQRGGGTPQSESTLANAYASGWCDALNALRTPGWAEYEAAWKRFLADVHADMGTHSEADAKAKFAADMERLRKTDPGGAQWVEHILSERTGLPDRQAKLLAAIQREGGEWAPIRARGVLVQAGYAVTKERAHQIMKQLAARGYLEQVRPRAYTYRLKTEKETP